VAKGSPNYHDGVFRNLEPASETSMTRQDQWRLVQQVLAGGADQRPAEPIPLVTPDPGRPAADLAVTWYGHSSAIIELDGYRVLADPVWGERCSPSRAVGPQRLHEPPSALDALPAIDAVIISHDHYDHLDVDTVKQLARTQRAKFFVPLGIGAHLRAWHIPDDRIVELDWNETAQLGDLTLVCTPARHFSGRFLSRNVTLWSSWALI
jgi:L-ascorbate metabolism protein UlaG (beta-lactamase superfamily)